MTTHRRPSSSAPPNGFLLPLIHFLFGILTGLLLLPYLPGPAEQPIQLATSPFSVDYLHPATASSPLFLSTSRFRCRPISVVLSGAVYPVKLEAVDAMGFDHSSQTFNGGEGGEVLGVVAERATAQIVLFSLDSVGEGGEKLVGKEAILRAVDAEGRTAYTTARKVKEPMGKEEENGNEEENAACRDTLSAVASTVETDTTACEAVLVSLWILIGCLLGLLVLLVVHWSS